MKRITNREHFETIKDKRCKACGDIKKLVVHHLRYDPDVVILLCEGCHNFIHKMVRGRNEDNEYFTRQFIKGSLYKLKG